MPTRICGALLVCGLLAACSSPGNINQSALPGVKPSEAPAALLAIAPHISHITVVIMENYDYEQIIGSASAPYINALARGSALFTNSHAVTHPSQPNYLALFSGSTQSVASDYCPVTSGAANLATELMSHGFTFQGYAEGSPSSGNACYGTYSSYVRTLSVLAQARAVE